MALSVVAIALGVALVVAIRLMNGAVLASFVDAIDATAGRAALVVSAGEGVSFPEDVRDVVARVPGVRLAVPLVRAVTFPDDGSGEILTVMGVDIGNDADVRVYHSADADPADVVDDILVFLAQPNSIILGAETARARGYVRGSTVQLVTPKGVQSFVVRGLLESEGLVKALGGRVVIMDLYAAERAFATDGMITQIDLLLTSGADPDVVREKVAAVLPAGLQVEEPAVRKDVLRHAVWGFQAMLTAFSLLAVVAGFVICYSRLGAIFEARTWEVGVLRAVGMRRAVVFSELLKESLLLGGIGTTVGVVVGFLIAKYALPVVAKATAVNFNLPVASTGAFEPASAVLLGMAVGLLSAIVAAASPALRLARRQPIAALAMRGRDIKIRKPFRSLAICGALVGFVLVLVVAQRFTGMMELGLVATVVLAIAASIGAVPFALHGSRLVRSLLPRLFGAAAEFAADSLCERPRQAALTIATVGVGIGASLMFGILGYSFQRTLVDRAAVRMQSDIIVWSALSSGSWMSAPLNEEILGEIRAVAGVAEVAGEHRKDVRYRGAVVQVDGYDGVSFVDSRLCRFPLEPGAIPKAAEIVSRGQGAIVTSSFARRFGSHPGMTIGLSSPHGLQEFAIVGVTKSEPTLAVIMNRERLKAGWNDAAVTWVRIALNESSERPMVEAAVAKALAARYRVNVRPGPSLLEYVANEVRKAFNCLYLMQGITLVLLLVAIGDTLGTGVAERMRQFGMMRAIGLHRSHLFAIVMLEGTAVGALGLLLAVVLGLSLGILWVRVQFPAMLGWDVDLHWPTRFASSAVVLSLILCGVGSILPALHAARLSLPWTLRNE